MGPTATDQEASSGSRNTASAVPSSSSVSGQQEDLTAGEQENADVDRGQKNEEISQQQYTSGTSSSSAAKLVGRFHIRPLRGALDGLSSLFSGRGGGGIKGKGREEMPKKAEDRKQKEEDDNDEKKMRREEEDEFGRKRRRDVDGNGSREEIAKVDEQEMVDTAAGEENAEDEDVNEDEDQPAGEEKREQQQPTTSSASATGFRQPKMEEENEDELLQPIEVRQQPRLTGEAAGGKAAPEPKPRRRLRRGSSLVHPMEAAETVGRAQPQVDDQDTNSGLAMRPRSLSVRHLQKALEPSQPSEWIYVQMPDRTFKRTTEAELQLMSRRNTLEKLPLDPSTLPEFAAVSAAIGVQRGFHAVATLLQGFLSGLAFAHAVFAFSLPGAESRLRWLAQFYAELAAPVQAIFYVGLAIAVVDSMDRLNFGAAAPTASQLFWRCFLSPAFVSILCWTAALLASLSSAQIDEYFGNGNLAALQRGDRLLLAVWRWASGARAGFAVLGWILAAFGRAENGGVLAELRQTMAIPIPGSQDGDGQQAEDRQNRQMTTVVDDVQNKV